MYNYRLHTLVCNTNSSLQPDSVRHHQRSSSSIVIKVISCHTLVLHSLWHPATRDLARSLCEDHVTSIADMADIAAVAVSRQLPATAHGIAFISVTSRATSRSQRCQAITIQ